MTHQPEPVTAERTRIRSTCEHCGEPILYRLGGGAWEHE